jgi:hypothetical protein
VTRLRKMMLEELQRLDRRILRLSRSKHGLLPHHRGRALCPPLLEEASGIADRSFGGCVKEASR